MGKQQPAPDAQEDTIRDQSPLSTHETPDEDNDEPTEKREVVSTSPSNMASEDDNGSTQKLEPVSFAQKISPPAQEQLSEEEVWMQEATSGPADTTATQPLPRVPSQRLEPTSAVPTTPPLPEQSLRPTKWQEAVALALLILVVAGSLIGLRFIPQTAVTPQNATDVTGPFVQQPLNSAQIDALRHLAGRMQAKQLASLYVSRMTLDEEIGQLIMVEYSDTSYSNDLDTMINQLHAGGVIMYEFQILTADQTKHDIAQMQQRATLPLLISTDEEGGPWVHRLKNIYGLRKSALDIYNSGDVAVATQEGHKVAQDLLSLGINENLAPDVDVALVNGIDQVTRTFGFTADSVIKYAGPYMKAMQSDGVVACIKHFPGLGDATVDAHTQLPIVNRTKQQLYDVELAPFKYFVQSPDQLERPGMVMPTDVLMPAIDPVMPAELSHTFMTDILRNEFGYDGVVLTDALYMGGVEVNGAPITMTQAAVMALNAGDDMILGPDGADQTLAVINAIKAALQNGTLSKARIDEAATRIIALKMQDHLMPAVPPQV
ncbi:MAG TPA: glycoside hydrolase family 3 N-terminal domain-containing protein [Ktedonosporobacter sp.]|nr:glycoside hydrolase family 3 N-terminal domain-containing protein [Ktedonosporobacter sp.]